jgi:LacI family transcriptional regulator
MMGVARFARRRAGWRFHLDDPSPSGLASAVARGSGGVIAAVQRADLARALSRRRLRVVNVSAALDRAPWPRVCQDDVAVGRAAAEHLLSRHLRNFAFAGDTHDAMGKRRLEGFRRALRDAGLDCALLPGGERESRYWPRPETALGLRALPRPLGVFAKIDLVGLRVTAAAAEAGLRVPDEVAVVGADNDELVCRFSRPPLSSVRIDFEEIGFRAAGVLARLLKGRPAPGSPVLVPPSAPAGRMSSDVVAVADPELASALRFIREHAHEYVGVEDVLRAAPVSRRSLERKFKETLGRSPYREIMQVRLERVRELLEDTDIPIGEVARRTGFGSPQHLANVFRERFGSTPTEYRRQRTARPGYAPAAPMPSSARGSRGPKSSPTTTWERRP